MISGKGTDEWKITQLMPANGWRALFACDSDDPDELYFDNVLIAWALVQHKTIEHKVDVVGVFAYDELGGEVGLAAYSDDFFAYLGPDEEMSKEEIGRRVEIIKNYKEDLKRELAL